MAVDIPQEEFDAILEEIAANLGWQHVPGVYECISEYYNNDVIKEWQDRQDSEEEEQRSEFEQLMSSRKREYPVVVRFFSGYKNSHRTPGPVLGPFEVAFMLENIIYGDGKKIAERSSSLDLWYICEDLIPKKAGRMQDPSYVHGFIGFKVEKH